MSKRIELIETDMRFLVVHDMSDPQTIQEYQVLTIGKDSYLTGKGYFLKDFCFPIQCKSELTAILTERQMLKKKWDDSMALVYKLINSVEVK